MIEKRRSGSGNGKGKSGVETAGGLVAMPSRARAARRRSSLRLCTGAALSRVGEHAPARLRRERRLLLAAQHRLVVGILVIVVIVLLAVANGAAASAAARRRAHVLVVELVR
ncbi:hypothetical protein FA09DRAFT_71911 [Tilletiopsis washingtonensis]|uniref:Uncharacterized protein n=1 Tax=Tilletiopsis washingtonensis TaxID=58919 RepID=A0A316Z9H3_9BASI|nr:hypothetical protein FA09DRAFT_71911 [Tilletiopsis washingtonensis]PWN96905.1 hypothetical protein FA09DRAFT_71911 [Tilletiopsis washingtonensis]